MHYATVRYTAPLPNHGCQPRMRRNTMEPSGRQHQLIQLVKASQQQQYAHEYIDDRSSFMRVQKAEEERIQQDLERALRAQRRNKARKAARASKAAEQAPSSPSNDLQKAIKIRPSIVEPLAKIDNVERGRLQSFEFPQLDTKPQTQTRFPLKLPATAREDPPPPLPKRLAPLPRYNPFVRARSESLSSLIEDEPPARDPAKRRNASVSALFARIHREAENMRLRHG